jgi:hypothetical protein
MSIAAALANSELAQPRRSCRQDVNRSNVCGRRRLRREIGHESVKSRLAAFDMDADATFLVEDPSVQRISAGETKHKGPKPDALHNASNTDGSSGGHSPGPLLMVQPRPRQPI